MESRYRDHVVIFKGGLTAQLAILRSALAEGSACASRYAYKDLSVRYLHDIRVSR